MDLLCNQPGLKYVLKNSLYHYPIDGGVCKWNGLAVADELHARTCIDIESNEIDRRVVVETIET